MDGDTGVDLAMSCQIIRLADRQLWLAIVLGPAAVWALLWAWERIL